jgi:hypothetical protein
VDEALDELAGMQTFDATHEEGPQTEVTLDLQHGDGAAMLVESFDPDTDQSSEECNSDVSIPIDVQLTTSADRVMCWELEGWTLDREACNSRRPRSRLVLGYRLPLGGRCSSLLADPRDVASQTREPCRPPSARRRGR